MSREKYTSEFAAGVFELAAKARRDPGGCVAKLEEIARLLAASQVSISAGELLDIVFQLAGPVEEGEEASDWYLHIAELAHRNLSRACREIQQSFPASGSSDCAQLAGAHLEWAFATARARRLRESFQRTGKNGSSAIPT